MGVTKDLLSRFCWKRSAKVEDIFKIAKEIQERMAEMDRDRRQEKKYLSILLK